MDTYNSGGVHALVVGEESAEGGRAYDSQECGISTYA